jgi:hypothetical protein
MPKEHNPQPPETRPSSAPLSSLNLEIYEPEIDCKTSSMLSGKHDEAVRFDQLPDIPVIKAWLADDDLQSLQVCSTNIGFVKEFQKRLRRSPENNKALPEGGANQL